jgi:hypothetical protein
MHETEHRQNREKEKTQKKKSDAFMGIVGIRRWVAFHAPLSD